MHPVVQGLHLGGLVGGVHRVGEDAQFGDGGRGKVVQDGNVLDVLLDEGGGGLDDSEVGGDLLDEALDVVAVGHRLKASSFISPLGASVKKRTSDRASDG